jgi:hypothetical protein
VTDTRWMWATVTTAGAAFRIRLDGDTNPLPYTPDSLIDPLALTVGTRVRCELTDRRVVVHGRSKGGGEMPRAVAIAVSGDTVTVPAGGVQRVAHNNIIRNDGMSLVGGRVVCPVAGWYHMYVSVLWPPMTDTGRSIGVGLNGGTAVAQRWLATINPTGTTRQGFSFLEWFAAGSQLDVIVGGQTASISGVQVAFFSVALVGAT